MKGRIKHMDIIDKQYLVEKNPWKYYSAGQSIIFNDKREIRALLKLNGSKSNKSILSILYETYFGNVLTDSSIDQMLKNGAVIDCPINGNPFFAKIILLYNNPALPNLRNEKFDTSISMQEYYEEKDQLEIIANNLTLNEKAKLLFTDEKSKDFNGGKAWYSKIYSNIKDAIKSQSREDYTIVDFQKDVCTLQWFAYPSKSFQKDIIDNHLEENVRELETHKFMVNLARYAIYQGKTVIAMRSVVRWEEALKPETIEKEGKGFINQNQYKSNYQNNFFISLNNLNPGPDAKYITKPLSEKIDLKKIL